MSRFRSVQTGVFRGVVPLFVGGTSHMPALAWFY